MKAPDGWTRHEDGTCLFLFGALYCTENTTCPWSISISAEGVQEVYSYEGGIWGRVVLEGRYKAVLECFVHAEDLGEARYYYLAAEYLRRVDKKLMRESPELERQAMQKALASGFIAHEELWCLLHVENAADLRSTMTQEQWLGLLVYAMSEGCWDYDVWVDDKEEGQGELLANFVPIVVAMLKAGYPGHADAIELFKEQLFDDMVHFELNPDAAKKYICDLVDRPPQESFELPELD